ncbi:Hypp8999 [Branchiostoma lanceolatum]|uniref:Hypp8999 protein n=1 Tax=Branchiostoma lanceolatum TaxID=7740 RepID=A0A8K0EFI3_BRALA|nr:Hypp8999 [Branchiostoma lanceolatum]
MFSLFCVLTGPGLFTERDKGPSQATTRQRTARATRERGGAPRRDTPEQWEGRHLRVQLTPPGRMDAPD